VLSGHTSQWLAIPILKGDLWGWKLSCLWHDGRLFCQKKAGKSTVCVNRAMNLLYASCQF
jgi:hypothetical protein